MDALTVIVRTWTVCGQVQRGQALIGAGGLTSVVRQQCVGDVARVM